MEVQQANGTRILELDTVRALHQTVVSLRAALEASKNELHHLRHKYESHTNKSCSVVHPENSLEEIPHSQEFQPEDDCTVEQGVILNVVPKESEKKVKFSLDKEQTKVEPQTSFGLELNVNGSEESELIFENLSQAETCGTSLTEPFVKKREKLNTLKQKNEKVKIKKIDGAKISNQSTRIIKNNSEANISSGEKIEDCETKIELESRFDLTIKVSASQSGELQPIVLESKDNSFVYLSHLPGSEVTSVSQSEEDTRVTVISSENVKFINNIIDTLQDQNTPDMAGAREISSTSQSKDKVDVQVKITSEEDTVVVPSPRKGSNSDYLNTEADDISIRSISEGDNSVFSIGGGGGGGGGEVAGAMIGGREQDSISGNDSEEVDDIELIFTTDDTKELTGFQEDLVSITEGDNWTGGQRSDASTPVLLRFNLLDPEHPSQERGDSTTSTENLKNLDLQGGMADTDMKSLKGILRKEIRNEGEITEESYDDVPSALLQGRRSFLRSSSSKNYLDTLETNQQYRKSFESNESYSFDNTKSSSFERGSSMDAETRELSVDHRDMDESLDQFDISKTSLRTQYSVYVETDISKCGVMEDDGFSGNLNVRRNTCPNPFQYRPLPHREVVKGVASGVRPMLALPGSRVPRRSSAAQTHISALPNHWRSDTQLSRKVLPSALTTLPGKLSAHLNPAPAPITQARRSEESRRVLLSDIGFTSMVPELSRSAEPVWACGLPPHGQPLPPTPPSRPLCCAHHAASCFGSVPSSPTRQGDDTMSRYWSKGSMQRSASSRMGWDGAPTSNRIGDQALRWRGSLPELRGAAGGCSAGRRGACAGHGGGARLRRAADSEDSTEELLDEAERFLRTSVDCLTVGLPRSPDDEFCPSHYSRPYLPSGPRHLRLGHLVKVIAPHGRIALGKVRYVGIAGGPTGSGGPGGPGATCTYVGLQLGAAGGGGDGTFRGRRYFHCDKGRSLFVPFSKVVMAWADC